MHIKIYYTQEVILYFSCRLPVEGVKYYVILDGYHQSGAVHDCLEAFEQTYEVRF